MGGKFFCKVLCKPKLDWHQFTWKLYKPLETILDILAMVLAISILKLSPCLGISTHTYCPSQQPVTIEAQSAPTPLVPMPVRKAGTWPLVTNQSSSWFFDPKLRDPALFFFTAHHYIYGFIYYISPNECKASWWQQILFTTVFLVSEIIPPS